MVNPKEMLNADADTAHQYGGVLHTGGHERTVFIHTVLQRGCDFGDDVGQIHGEGTVDDDHLRIEYI